MFWIDVLIALAVGIILTTIFSMVIGRTGPWDNIFLFFIIIFLGAWAGGLWLRNTVHGIYGYYWFSYLIVGLLIAILIAATGPVKTKPERNKIELKSKRELRKENKNPALKKMDIFLSILIILLLLIILIGYMVIA